MTHIKLHERKEIQYNPRTKHLLQATSHENDKIRYGVALFQRRNIVELALWRNKEVTNSCKF